MPLLLIIPASLSIKICMLIQLNGKVVCNTGKFLMVGAGHGRHSCAPDNYLVLLIRQHAYVGYCTAIIAV